MKEKYFIKYSSDMRRGFDMSEIFGICPYLSSPSEKIYFSFDKNSKILDIGGFIGDSTVFFAKQGTMIYVFEPQKKAFDLILDNMRLNKLKNFKSYNKAITHDGRDIILDDNEKITDDIDVMNLKKGSLKKIVKFSDALKNENQWSLIKIDIEGGEWSILEEIIRNVRLVKNVKGFIIELHDYSKNKNLLKRFIDLLKKKGFNVEIQLSGRLGMLWVKRD
jgi:FkbM family methyltransferase